MEAVRPQRGDLHGGQPAGHHDRLPPAFAWQARSARQRCERRRVQESGGSEAWVRAAAGTRRWRRRLDAGGGRDASGGHAAGGVGVVRGVLDLFEPGDYRVQVVVAGPFGELRDRGVLPGQRPASTVQAAATRSTTRASTTRARPSAPRCSVRRCRGGAAASESVGEVRASRMFPGCRPGLGKPSESGTTPGAFAAARIAVTTTAPAATDRCVVPTGPPSPIPHLVDLTRGEPIVEDAPRRDDIAWARCRRPQRAGPDQPDRDVTPSGRAR